MDTDSSTAVLDPPVVTAREETLTIRPARWEHAPAIIEIIRSSASWYEDIVEPEDLAEHYVDEAWAKRNFESRDFYVALIDEEVVGTISLQAVGTDELYIGYLYLHTDQVGKGFGKVLMDFASDEVRRQGRSALVLLAHPKADWACRAYRKYGFEVVLEDREKVLSWRDGWLEPYYEEGFHLYRYQV